MHRCMDIQTYRSASIHNYIAGAIHTDDQEVSKLISKIPPNRHSNHGDDQVTRAPWQDLQNDLQIDHLKDLRLAHVFDNGADCQNLSWQWTWRALLAYSCGSSCLNQFSSLPIGAETFLWRFQLVNIPLVNTWLAFSQPLGASQAGPVRKLALSACAKICLKTTFNTSASLAIWIGMRAGHVARTSQPFSTFAHLSEGKPNQNSHLTPTAPTGFIHM